MWQKVGEFLKPARYHYQAWNNMQDSIPDKGWLQSKFSTPIKPKSDDQLGYLYSGIYPHFIAHYTDTQGYAFQIQTGGELIDIKANKISIDLLLKKLFCIHKSIPEFFKEKASTQDLKEYIDFLGEHSFNKFGCRLPPPKYNNKIKEK